MAERPHVSIVIPTFNRARLLGRALRSVFAQTYRHCEVIVVDDASQDDTEQVVATFDRDCLSYVHHTQNQGGGATRNAGIERAKGEWIAFLDSDDEYLPQRLEKQIRAISQAEPEIGAAYCSFFHEDDTRDIRQRVDVALRQGDVYGALLRGWCPASTSLFLVRAEALAKVGGFDEALPSFQDYDLWLRLAQQYPFQGIPDPLVVKHHHAGERIVRDEAARKKGLEMIMDKWREAFEMEGTLNTFRQEQLFSIHRRVWLNHLKQFHVRKAIGRLGKARNQGVHPARLLFSGCKVAWHKMRQMIRGVRSQ